MFRLILFMAGMRLINALENGLARTPPMGWSSWNVYYCSPGLTDKSIREVADILVDNGFAAAGYEFIILDDGWQSSSRQNTFLQANPDRFPVGIENLAEYIHIRGMKLGLFSDIGKFTGCGYPGTADHFKEDANTFAQWKVDYVKMSGYLANPYMMDEDYPNFRKYLEATSRHMVYATSWVAYQKNLDNGYFLIDYKKVAENSNTWRFGADAQASWNAILGIMDEYANDQIKLKENVKLGAWNDADLLVVGQNGVTLDQCQAQMAVWSIIPSPLIFSVHPSNLTQDQKALLQNKAIIAVNRDRLGLPGERYAQWRVQEASYDILIDVWLRPIAPTYNGFYSYAIAFVNRNEYSRTIYRKIKLYKLGLTYSFGYYVTNLLPLNILTYDKTWIPSSGELYMTLKPSGVAFFKAEIEIEQNSSTNLSPSLFLSEIIQEIP